MPTGCWRIVLSKWRRRHSSGDMDGTCATHHDLSIVLVLRRDTSISTFAASISFISSWSTNAFIGSDVFSGDI